jgi:hypothetical protein
MGIFKESEKVLAIAIDHHSVTARFDDCFLNQFSNSSIYIRSFLNPSDVPVFLIYLIESP